MEGLEQSVDSLEELQAKRIGNTSSKISSKKFKTDENQAPRLPDTCLPSRSDSFLQSNVFGTKLAFPHETPRSSSSSTEPDCLSIERKGSPPLSVPLNEEGDRVVFKLVGDSIKEYLSLGAADCKLRDDYKWIDRWVTMRYKKFSYPQGEYKPGRKSLDEILNSDSDSDDELLFSSNSANIAKDRTSVSSHDSSISPTFVNKDKLYINKQVPCINLGKSLSSTQGVLQGNLQKNDLEIPRINFYNSIPSTSDVPQNNFQKSGFETPQNNVDCSLLDDSRVISTNLSGCSELSQLSDVEKMNIEVGETSPGNFVLDRGIISPLKNSLVSILSSSSLRKVRRKSVHWSSNQAAFQEIDRLDHRAVNRKKAKNGDEARTYGTKHRSMRKVSRPTYNDCLTSNCDFYDDESSNTSDCCGDYVHYKQRSNFKSASKYYSKKPSHRRLERLMRWNDSSFLPDSVEEDSDTYDLNLSDTEEQFYHG